MPEAENPRPGEQEPLSACIRTLACAVALFLGGPQARPRAVPKKPVSQPIAVLVHHDNPAKNLPLADLMRLYKLEKQFWDDKSRVILLTRPSDTKEQLVLLDRVYGMNDKELRKLWIEKLNAGTITAIPTVVKTAEAAANAVTQSAGAITVVLAADAPSGSKVLAIDGKKPGDDDYPLMTKE